MSVDSAPLVTNGQENKTACPRCGGEDTVLTDKPGLDRCLALYYQKNGFGLIEVCMCTDARQLSVLWNNILRRAMGMKGRNKFLACPDCAFWQIMD